MKILEKIRTVEVALKNLALGGNLVSVSRLGNPREMLAYVGESLFLYKAMTAKRGIPQKNVFEVLPCPGAQAVTLGELGGQGTFWGPVASYTADLVSLCLICQLIKPKVVFEIGTLMGCTTYQFAINTPAEAKIYTLDLPKNGSAETMLRTTAMDDHHIASRLQTGKYAFEGTNVSSKISCLFGDSARFDFSAFRGAVDFFFIDGAHSYEYVRSDTLKAFECCHPGSVIAWHDFGRVGVNGVSKWLIELSKRQEIFSIPGGSLAFAMVK